MAGWLTAFKAAGCDAGMILNMEKCEVIAHPDAVMPPAFAEAIRQPLCRWELLGVPCGSDEAVREESAARLAREITRIRVISGLGHRVDEPDAAHIALALLRTTAGFPAVVSLMRGVGALADFGVVDRAMCEAVGRLTGVELAGESWLQAALPTRLGGLGLHVCRDFAAIAGIAAPLDGKGSSARLVASHQLASGPDNVVAASLACPRLAQFPSVLADVTQADRPGCQPGWAKAIVGARSDTLRGALAARGDENGLARLLSCSAPHASGWLYGCAEASDEEWLTGPELVTALRARLGLPVSDAEGPCRVCGVTVADRFGVHGMCCLVMRTRVHHGARDCHARQCNRGLMAPRKEHRPFSSAAYQSSRVDIWYERKNAERLLDFAVVCAQQPSDRRYAAAAVKSAGGAADLYSECKKLEHYAPMLLAEPPERAARMKVVPMVVDSFGAWGAAAVSELQATARAISSREGKPYSAVCQRVFHEHNFLLIRGMARNVNAAAFVTDCLGERPRPPSPDCPPGGY